MYLENLCCKEIATVRRETLLRNILSQNIMCSFSFLDSLITSCSFIVLFCIPFSLISNIFFSNNFHLHQVNSQNLIVGYFAHVFSSTVQLLPSFLRWKAYDFYQVKGVCVKTWLIFGAKG